ncbi:MAG TPA: histidine kinase [Bacillota bacterium]|nr:histidine kinase [Bacillota bacterium]
MRAGPRVLLLLALVALVPALTLAGLSLGVVRNLARLAGEQSQAAVEQEAAQRLAARATGLAHAHDTFLGQVRRRAETLAGYVQWLYAHPGFYPPFLAGGSPLERAAAGHLVNAPGTPVGVFVSRRVSMTPAHWQEAGLLSQVDPFLAATGDETPTVASVWVITATGILRVYPNPALGHPGSPVGPDDDPRDWEAFQAALPDRNLGGHAIWTTPHIHPAGSGEFIAVAAPVRAGDGSLLAVAGVHIRLEDAVTDALQAGGDAAGLAFLADPGGRPITPLPAGLRLAPGSALESLPDLAGRLEAIGPGGLVMRLAGQPEPVYLALARLPEAGWLLGVVAPAAAVEAPAREVRAEILAVQAGLLRDWGLALAGVLLGVLVAAQLATLALTRPIGRLVEGTRHLGSHLSHRLPDSGRDELGDLARALNRMAAQIQSSRREALEAAREAGEERERSVRRREIAVLEERNRLAREIHDTLAQGLTAMVLQLETAEDALADEPAQARSLMLRARQLARDSLQEARRSVWNLRPQALELGGLASGLAGLARHLEEAGIAVELRVPDLEPPPAAAEALYRIAQEALANVRRHSRATRAELSLVAREGGVELRVADNGRGFTGDIPQSPTGGFGMWAMRERAREAGGRLTVTGAPGAGTTVAAWLPLEGGEPHGEGDPGPDRG